MMENEDKPGEKCEGSRHAEFDRTLLKEKLQND
jgi:hypothetical protein